MKYQLSYQEYIIKSDDDVYIKLTSGASARAKLILTNRNLMVFYDDEDMEESLRIFPMEHFNSLGGAVQIDTGIGKQPYFEVYFPDSSLYVFFGHSVRRGWQQQDEGRVQQWVSAINNAVGRYESQKYNVGMSAPVRPGQYSNNYIYHISSAPANTTKPSFCAGCGSPLTQDDVFCVACGRRV